MRRKAGLFLVQIDGNQGKIDRRALLQIAQDFEQDVAVLAPGQADHDAIPFLNHGVIGNRLAYVAPQAFLKFINVVLLLLHDHGVLSLPHNVMTLRAPEVFPGRHYRRMVRIVRDNASIDRQKMQPPAVLPAFSRLPIKAPYFSRPGGMGRSEGGYVHCYLAARPRATRFSRYPGWGLTATQQFLARLNRLKLQFRCRRDISPLPLNRYGSKTDPPWDAVQGRGASRNRAG